jgi:malonyl-CoA O-methyltransferase
MAGAANISAREGYERWAPSYPQVAGNPLMRIEQAMMLKLWPPVAGRRVLDLACGSGRYTQLLAAAGAEVVALDFSPAMLRRAPPGGRVCASMMRQPFAAAAFDVVISGLAIGHTADLAGWMAETARVLRPGGTLLYSDLHPEAARAGLTRSFTDELRHSYTLPHWGHELDVQRAAAAAAQLEIVTVAEARVGIELTEPFAGSEAFYRRWHGLPLVVAVEARRR